MQGLLSWALSQGARVNKLLGTSDNPREFIASEDIAPGDTLITLPQHLLLHAGCAYEDAEFGEAFRILSNEGAGQDPRNILGLLLVLERSRGDSSKWAPYIYILPRQYEDPYWWSDEELEMLRGTRLGRAFTQHGANLAQLGSWIVRLDEIQRSLNPQAPSSTLSTYCDGWALTPAAVLWGRSTVWSRSFKVHRMAQSNSMQVEPQQQKQQEQQVEPQQQQQGQGQQQQQEQVEPQLGQQQQVEPHQGQQQQAQEQVEPQEQQQEQQQEQGTSSSVLALVPVLDMIDHSPEVEAVWHTGEDGKEDFTFTPLTAFQAGTPVRNNYGCKTNDELLLAYGFVIPNNPADYFHVSMSHGSFQGSSTASNGSLALVRTHSHGPIAPESYSLVIRPDGLRPKPTDVAPAAATSSGGGGDDGGTGGDTPPGVQGGGAAQLTASPTTSGERANCDPSVVQDMAEEMQRQKILTLLNIPLEHHLTLTEPIPQALLLSTQACLLPSPELYVTSSVVLGGCSNIPAGPSPQGPGDNLAGPLHKLVKAEASASHWTAPPQASYSLLGKRKLEGGEEADIAALASSATMSAPPTATDTTTSTGTAAHVSTSRTPAPTTSPPGAPSTVPTGGADFPVPQGFPLRPSPEASGPSPSTNTTPRLPSTAVHVTPLPSATASTTAENPSASGHSPQHNACILLGCDSNIKKELAGHLTNCLFCGTGRVGGRKLRLPQDMRMLVALRQQLESKLANMATEADLSRLSSGTGKAEGKETTSSHAQLVTLYVMGQRKILDNSLQMLLKTISRVLHSAASAATSDGTSDGTANVDSVPPVSELPLRSVLDYVFPIEGRPSGLHPAETSCPSLGTPPSQSATTCKSTGTSAGEASAAGGRGANTAAGGDGAAADDGGAAAAAAVGGGSTVSAAGASAANPPANTLQKGTTTDLSEAPDMTTTDIVGHMGAYSAWLESHGIRMGVQQQSQSPSPSLAREEIDATTASDGAGGGTTADDDGAAGTCATTAAGAAGATFAAGGADAGATGTGATTTAGAPPSSSNMYPLTEVITQLRPNAIPTCAELAKKVKKNLSFRAQQRNASAAALHAEMSRLHSHVGGGKTVLPSGISCSLGLEQEHDPVSWGAHVTATTPAGGLLLQVPVVCALLSASKVGLVRQLMVPAHRILNGLIASATRGLGISDEAAAVMMSGGRKGATNNNGNKAGSEAKERSRELPSDMLVLHLLHTVGAGAAARLAMSESDGMRMVFEMLEDSPSGATYGEIFSTLEEDFTHLKSSLSANQASSSSPEHLQHVPSDSEIASALTWSGGFGLYCWAVQAVDRGAVQVSRPGAEMLWALAPLVCAIPPELKEAVLNVTWEERPEQVPPSQGGVTHTPSTTSVLAVHAACHLTAGLPLTPSVLLRWMDCDSMFAAYGPEALAWHSLMSLTIPSDPPSHTPPASSAPAPTPTPALLASQLPPPATSTATATYRLSDETLSAPASTSAPASAPATAPDPASAPAPATAPSSALAPITPAPAQAPNKKRRIAPGVTSRRLNAAPPLAPPLPPAPTISNQLPTTAAPAADAATGADPFAPKPGLLLYELYIAPSEDDVLYQKKMELLTAAGLGTVHYLTKGLETKVSIIASLRICLADVDLLMDPTVLALIELHASRQRPTATSSLDSLDPSTSSCGAAPMSGTSGPPPKEGREGNTPLIYTVGGSCKQRELMQQVTLAQQRLIGMLLSLADDHPASQAARRQLRHLISDARKHAKRRLRQMDAMKHSEVGTRLCGGVTPAVREGVRCYLKAIAHVLDLWSEHLGLMASGHSGASSGLLASGVPGPNIKIGGDNGCDWLKKRKKLEQED